MKLTNILMHDGSRDFGALPECFPFEQLRDHVAKLPEAKVTRFVSDGVTEAWLHFRYRGHQFAANTQCGEWWFFVNDPQCPDEILLEVLTYCAKKLGQG
ncbi:hypothetical protein [Bremerella sp. P1]|uniref:hypothetical protein n=1 Tax=Bremerella sp. P1 TaxID=3026424 RepID=UPI0023678D52|nr:hypothetical protein [Bremerella sp. P1]WDI43265.1 hypothetical protein PSR63_04810 [Bremerella sp. P1]